MVGIGIVGIGFMGMIHYLGAGRVPNAKVVAISTRDPKKRAGDWTSIQGNFGPRGEQMDLSGVNAYEKFEDLLADPNVSLVDLCVPNADHARMAIAAMKAGKDVLVEKPIALNLEDANLMVQAAKETGRKLMVAHVLPFFGEFAFAANAIQTGKYGKVLAANFYRVISKPDWSSGISDAELSGGPAIDLHIHDTHFIGWLFGKPNRVSSRGVVDSGVVVHLQTNYEYDSPDSPVISCTSGAISQNGRPFAHGYEIFLEKATLKFEYANLGKDHVAYPLTVILPDGKVEYPTLEGGDAITAFANEIQVAVDNVSGKPHNPMLDGDLARLALSLCKAEVQSVIESKPVTVD
ncbi:MAG: hypothetical protein RJA81_1185 [Planctomycetota bacterium]|jgi:predicted dehydrogenase